MLQRAASNAYSWWWASHIRTRQSKWLDNNLQEMEHRVKCILLLLGEEADSFAKRAEMYYKRRPEVINSVEEAYRAYRALAERYDHMSGELHKANHTIANAFPDQVQYAMLEEDNDNLPKAFTMVDPGKIHKATVEELMKKKKKGGQLGLKDRGKNSAAPLNKENAQTEISRLQKEILVLQTEKEFIKSSYESGIAKYWDLERQINDMQEEVCYFQEEFNESAVIEDDEARALMTGTALKSCEDTIIKLQEQQRLSSSQAMIESERVKLSREKLKVIMTGYGKALSDSANYSEDTAGKNGRVELEDVYYMKQEKSELQTIIDKIKEHFETDSDLSVAEVAEKIDELVNKVVDLELMVSSQNGQINRMCLENTKLEKSLQELEEEKTVLMSGSSELNYKLKQAEDELIRVQTLKSSFHADEAIVYSNFTETISSFHDISEMLQLPIIEHQASSAPMLTDEAMASINTEPSSECHVTQAAEDSDIDEAGKNPNIDEFTDHPEKLQPANINGKSMTSCGCNETKTEKHYVVDDSENLWPFELEDMSVAAPLVEKETTQCADMDSSGDHNKTEIANVHDVVSNVGSSTQLDIIHSEERGFLERLHHISCIGPGDLNVTQEISKQDSSTSAHVISEGHLEQKTTKEEYSDTRENSSSSSGKAGEVGSSMQSDIVHSQERCSLEQLHCFYIGPGDLNVKQEEMSKQDSSTSGHVISEGYLEQKTNKAEDSDTRGNSAISSTGKGGEFGDQENMIKLQQLLMNGLQDKEKVLLAEYTSILRNYKDAKRRLTEAETMNQECLNEMTAMISALRCANAIKDEEIRSLHELLKDASCNGLQKNLSVSFSMKGGPRKGHRRTPSFLSVHQRRQSVSSISRMIIKNSNLENDSNLKSPTEGDASNDTATDPESLNLEDFKLLNTVEMENTSPLEEKFRRDIDALLEENLEFWMKFSTSFQRIQGFQTKHEKLQSEVGKLINDDKLKPNNSSVNDPLAKDESVAMEKQLRALKTELQVWLEQNAMLRGELQCRFTSLCNIQEEITGALEMDADNEEGAHITSYQAAKFQGEVLNMKQENNKVSDELQAGLDHIKGLQAETEKALAKLLKTTSLSEPKGSSNMKHVLSKSRVPLRSFLFPAKNKKPSLFACVNPAFQKQHSDMKFFTKME